MGLAVREILQRGDHILGARIRQGGCPSRELSMPRLLPPDPRGKGRAQPTGLRSLEHPFPLPTGQVDNPSDRRIYCPPDDETESISVVVSPGFQAGSATLEATNGLPRRAQGAGRIRWGWSSPGSPPDSVRDRARSEKDSPPRALVRHYASGRCGGCSRRDEVGMARRREPPAGIGSERAPTRGVGGPAALRCDG